MSIRQMAQKIVRGEIISQEIKVTIPEGFTLKQIDARLAQAGLIEPDELINFDPNQVTSYKLQVTGLEGYLFPDTYRFFKQATIEEIIQKMLDNFDRKVTQDLRDEIARQDKTLEEIIIMASLLEKEVPTYEDRRIVAGIFWQRLEDNYPLESCATIAYILEVDKWRYSYQDTRIKSPYNTYLNIGLPPTPINNPGLAAIQAAIEPQKTDAYFFLSDPVTGQTIFSQTLEEHNSNKAKYLQ
jgi:UPF0755 protein